MNENDMLDEAILHKMQQENEALWIAIEDTNAFLKEQERLSEQELRTKVMSVLSVTSVLLAHKRVNQWIGED